MSRRRKGRQRLATALTGSAILAASTAAVQGSPAGAFPHATNGCDDGSMTYYVAGGFGDHEDDVIDGLNSVNDALDYDGTRLVNVSEDELHGTVKVQPTSDDPGVHGDSDCGSTGLIHINKNGGSTASYYRHVARHELMHLAGAMHSGRYDSYNGDDPPTMATCLDPSDFNPMNTLSQDDAAAENYLHSSAAYAQLHANWGFEQGTSYWGFTGGSWSYKTSGGVTGPGNVAFNSPSGNDYAYQTIDLATGNSDHSYRVVARAKGGNSSYKNIANVALFGRYIDYGNTSNGCGYSDGLKDLNTVDWVGGYVERAQSGTTTLTTSSWGSSLVSSWWNPSGDDGYVIQVRLYTLSQPSGGGSTGAVYIDNVRGEST